MTWRFVFFPALLLSGAIAHAADVTESANSWTGAYVGLAAGVSQHDVDWTNEADDWFNGTRSFGSTSGTVGGYAGYNLDAGGLVWGVEADIAAAFNEDSAKGTDYDETYSNELQWIGSVRGRVGVPVNNMLIYATGGWAFAGVNNTSQSSDYPDQDFEHTDEIVTGLVYGGGVDFALSEKATMRLEGLAYDFGEKTYSQPGDPSDKMTISNSVIIGRIGFAYKF